MQPGEDDRVEVIAAEMNAPPGEVLISENAHDRGDPSPCPPITAIHIQNLAADTSPDLALYQVVVHFAEGPAYQAFVQRDTKGSFAQEIVILHEVLRQTVPALHAALRAQLAAKQTTSTSVAAVTTTEPPTTPMTVATSSATKTQRKKREPVAKATPPPASAPTPPPRPTEPVAPLAPDLEQRSLFDLPVGNPIAS